MLNGTLVRLRAMERADLKRLWEFTLAGVDPDPYLVNHTTDAASATSKLNVALGDVSG